MAAAPDEAALSILGLSVPLCERYESPSLGKEEGRRVSRSAGGRVRVAGGIGRSVVAPRSHVSCWVWIVCVFPECPKHFSFV